MTDPQIRAAEAERIMNEPLVQEAIARIKADTVTAWLATPTDKPEQREVVWRHAKAAEKFEAIFRGYMESGKMAEFNEKQRLMDRALRIIR